jgi:nitrile hydratase
MARNVPVLSRDDHRHEEIGAPMSDDHEHEHEHEHEHPPGHMHLEDPDANVAAIVADLEYFRRKRLESRLLFMARRGYLPLPELLKAAQRIGPMDNEDPHEDLDDRIKALQERLNSVVNGILSLQVPIKRAAIAIEDTRLERGDYDERFRLAKRDYPEPLLQRIAAVEEVLGDCELLIAAAQEALVASGEVAPGAFEQRIEALKSIGWRNGARIVARAWVDEGFRERLLTQGRETVRELDIPPGKLGILGIAENSDDVHNVVVCTLCSCYPHDLLGNPPWWYRTDGYKDRVIADPRGMLKEAFDLEIPEGKQIRVHDSTSDVRWMVIPQRPEGTEGLSEEELAELVTPESLVGTALAGQIPASDPHVARGLDGVVEG